MLAVLVAAGITCSTGIGLSARKVEKTERVEKGITDSGTALKNLGEGKEQKGYAELVFEPEVKIGQQTFAAPISVIPRAVRVRLLQLPEVL